MGVSKPFTRFYGTSGILHDFLNDSSSNRKIEWAKYPAIITRMTKNIQKPASQYGSRGIKSSPRKSRKTWSGIKTTLKDLSCEALIGLLHDLYKANEDNRAFLHARFGPADDSLDPYLSIISRWINPDHSRNQAVSVSKAKKAISDYKKAIGRPEGIAELTIHYCEECIEFLDFCGYEEASYYDALILMFERALKAVQTADADTRAGYMERLESVMLSCDKFGYGVGIEMRELMSDHRL